MTDDNRCPDWDFFDNWKTWQLVLACVILVVFTPLIPLAVLFLAGHYAAHRIIWMQQSKEK